VLEFIEFPAFTTRLLALAKEYADDVLLEIQNDLLENPKRGPVIEGTSGVRKSRAADPTRGKYYIECDGQNFLLMVFNKNEQDNLTKKQKKTLSTLIRGLREEGQ
jgi:hypothetical protein